MDTLEKDIQQLEVRLREADNKVKQFLNLLSEFKEFIEYKIEDIRKEKDTLTVEYNEKIIELWIRRGSEGMNKALSLDEVPKIIRDDFKDILMETYLRAGCTLDCNCENCNKSCNDNAIKRWREKYGI